MWVSLYNSQIAATIGGLDLVIIVIECAERPSAKEFQVFAVLNQALKAIKSENLVNVLQIRMKKMPKISMKLAVLKSKQNQSSLNFKAITSLF